ncbi:conserved hypothetical protein [Magnetococcus marinus MC-1]|uniref:DUF6362 domain-containing protein n=1 Tax=Magnetococcus marinus (strain ATCC BAA-1437 / JCM 17883 / MC-1) TaxID=156889 RepID=A0LBB3_MAGMM|nr:DUF6362 family protein [Magnetococcus marinus]ABK45256.1 conserved hypothetical protein [Magnetococcus marinus MC-1]
MREQKWDAPAVAKRLEEAAFTMKRLPVKGLKPEEVRSAWPEVIHEFYDAYGWGTAEARLGPPSPSAIDRLDEVMGWLEWLEPDHRRLVWYRAERVPWKLLMRRFGRARSTLAAHWKSAIFQVVAVLNQGKRVRTF